MDGKYSAEMLKHLEKQSEVLMEAYRSLSHEIHRLQVEEEMMMRKFYEVTSTQELNKKNKNEKSSSSETGKGQLKALGFNPSNQS